MIVVGQWRLACDEARGKGIRTLGSVSCKGLKMDEVASQVEERQKSERQAKRRRLRKSGGQ